MSESKDLEAVTAPPAGECAFMVLLVDDQAIIGEALRRALVNEPDIGFHFCSNPAAASRPPRKSSRRSFYRTWSCPASTG